jgi:signal peptidase II
MKFLFCLFGVLGIVALDQSVKALVVAQVELQDRIPLVPGLLTLTHIRNFGAAYNLMTGFALFLILVPGLIMLGGLLYLAFRAERLPPMVRLSVTMIIGGGLGNLTDRIRLGYVVDFLDIRIIPVFNVADMFITAGCLLLVLYLLFFDRKNDAS